MSIGSLDARARAYAALGDPSRLAIVDLLANADLASGELGHQLGIPTNLIAHHLKVLEEAGLIQRRRSEGDGRRTYVTRTRACNDLIRAGRVTPPHKVAFVCSQNSARSQLAESYWGTISDIPVVSGGTHPARRVHPHRERRRFRGGLRRAHCPDRRSGRQLRRGRLTHTGVVTGTSLCPEPSDRWRTVLRKAELAATTDATKLIAPVVIDPRELELSRSA